MSTQSNNNPVGPANQTNKRNGCLYCGERGKCRYCHCLCCACCHVGHICPFERDDDKWSHYWLMLNSDLISRPETRPTKPPTTSQGGDLFNPCNRGQYHGMTRDCWK